MMKEQLEAIRKGALEAIFQQLSIHHIEFVPCTDDPSYHPGRTAAIIRQEMDLRLAGYKQPLAQSNATMEYTKLSKSPI